jgi:hypothetical protein
MPTERDLEDVLHKAAMMAQLTFHWVAHAIGQEKSNPPPLTAHESQLLYFAVSETSFLIQEADDIFQGRQQTADP